MKKKGLLKFINFFYCKSKKDIPIASTMIMITALTDGIGIMLIIPLLSTLNISNNENSEIVSLIKSIFEHLNIDYSIVSIILLYIILILFRSLTIYFRDTLLQKVQLEFVDQFRNDLHKSIGQTKWQYLIKKRSSEFMNTLTNDIGRIGFGAYLVVKSSVSLFMILTYIILSLYLSTAITIIVLISGALTLFLMKSFARKSKQLGHKLTESNEQLFSSADEFISGIKMVKSFNANEYYENRFIKDTQTLRKNQLHFNRLTVLAQQLSQVASALILSLLFYFSIETFEIETAELLVLGLIFIRLMPLLTTTQRNYEQLQHTIPAFLSAMQLKEDCQTHAEPSMSGNIKPLNLNTVLRLDNITFHYHTQTTPSLIDINTCIQANSTTAIVGFSGAGKSTLADLLAGLMLPQKGHIIINKQPLSEALLHHWRASVAYVPQDNFLFNDTLRANLLWAKPDSTDKELWQALSTASAKTFVEQLPEGLETVLGERGIRLSGGERQRLALARALLRKPTLLILDEATSALDSFHEKQIQQSIENLHGQLTIIVIAHRLSTIRKADKIIVMDKGRIAQEGEWQMLSEDKAGLFYRLKQPSD